MQHVRPPRRNLLEDLVDGVGFDCDFRSILRRVFGTLDDVGLGSVPADHGQRAVLVKHLEPKAIHKEIETLVEREPLPYSLEDPPREQFTIIHALRRHNAVIDVHRGPAYAFLGPIPVVSGILPLGPAQAAYLHPALATLAPELASRQPCFAAVEDGVAVSVCYSARTGAQAAEAGVETVEAYRGRGHATRVAAAWAAAVRAQGLLPLYSTSWENAASRAVARHLGIEPYAENWHIG